jgi:hypothetical protein
MAAAAVKKIYWTDTKPSFDSILFVTDLVNCIIVGAGWFLEKIIVTESSDDQDSETKYFFPCNRWLDEGQDDGLIVRDLRAVAGRC